MPRGVSGLVRDAVSSSQRVAHVVGRDSQCIQARNHAHIGDRPDRGHCVVQPEHNAAATFVLQMPRHAQCDRHRHDTSIQESATGGGGCCCCCLFVVRARGGGGQRDPHGGDVRQRRYNDWVEWVAATVHVRFVILQGAQALSYSPRACFKCVFGI